MNIGQMYYELGNYKEAIEFTGQSVAIKKDIQGEINIEVANLVLNIGWYYKNLGDNNKALEYYEKAFPVF